MRSTQLLALGRAEILHGHAGVVEDDVVRPGLGEDVVAGLREVEDGLLPLRVSERVHEREPAVLLVLKDGCPLVLAGRGDDRFGSGEERRHHDLIAKDEVVDDGVVAVELPSPRFGGRRLAHDGDVVLPLAVLVEVVAGQLAERFVQVHDVARLLQSFRAQ